MATAKRGAGDFREQSQFLRLDGLWFSASAPRNSPLVYDSLGRDPLRLAVCERSIEPVPPETVQACVQHQGRDQKRERPFRLSRLLLTYPLPRIPLLFGWDGTVSALRAYLPDELLAIVRAVPGAETYTWSAGVAGKALYLTGVPTHR